jgi:hypothetical protein
MLCRRRKADRKREVHPHAEGLRSLAYHLLALAEEQPGTHLHLDRSNKTECAEEKEQG